MWLLLAVNPIGLPVANARTPNTSATWCWSRAQRCRLGVSYLESRTAIGDRVAGIHKATTASGQKSKPAVARVAGFQPSTSRKSRQRGFDQRYEAELEQVQGERDRVVSQLNQSSSEVDEADETIVSLTTRLESTEAELTEVKRVSAAALDLDLMNQQLVAELESERSMRTCYGWKT